VEEVRRSLIDAVGGYAPVIVEAAIPPARCDASG
jgi:hypothetical protein